MTRFILAAALAAAPLAAQAQDEGPNLLEEGAELFLRGLLDEVQPPLAEIAGIGAKHLLTLQAIAQEMGPAFAEVFEQIDSISYYQPPEILPNGDIVIRRNPGAPAWQPPAPESEPETAPEIAPEPEPDLLPEPELPETEPDNGLNLSPGLGLEL